MSNNNEQDNPENNNCEENSNEGQAGLPPLSPPWQQFPDLLRAGVADHLQSNGSLEPQRASVANPPDVSLPGAAGRDPPPPDFNLIHNNIQAVPLPDMAIDANAGAAAAAAQATNQHHGLPDMALDVSGDGHEAGRGGASCGSGVRYRPRRQPGSLASMAGAAVGNNVPQPDPFNLESRVQSIQDQLQELRLYLMDRERERQRYGDLQRIIDELARLRMNSPPLRDRNDPALDNRLTNIETLIQRLLHSSPASLPQSGASTSGQSASTSCQNLESQSPGYVASLVTQSLNEYREEERRRRRRETERLARILAESFQAGLSHFMQELNKDEQDEGVDE